MQDLFSFVIAPLFVGLIIHLVVHWLDDYTIAMQVVLTHTLGVATSEKKPILVA